MGYSGMPTKHLRFYIRKYKSAADRYFICDPERQYSLQLFGKEALSWLVNAGGLGIVTPGLWWHFLFIQLANKERLYASSI